MPDIAEQLESHRGVMRLSEFAEMLGVCYMTAYRWARNSGLPAAKIAGIYWVDPHSTARWWREHSTAMMKPPATMHRRRRGAPAPEG